MSFSFKKINLTYNEIPSKLGLPASLFVIKYPFPDDPISIINRSDEERAYVKKVTVEIDRDLDRTSYVALGKRTKNDLKHNWLLTDATGTLQLAPHVYPHYLQGDITGDCIGKMLFDAKVAMPWADKDINYFTAIQNDLKQLSFCYINDKGEPAGFSLVTVPNGAENNVGQGWVITSIQNTTAPPDKRRITVLATDNFIPEVKADSVANSWEGATIKDNLSAQLDAALLNGQIKALVLRAFNDDGSINADELTSLSSRIEYRFNFDDRDTKVQQLKALFAYMEAWNIPGSNVLIANISNRMDIEVDFFETDRYNTLVSNVTDFISSNKPNAKRRKEVLQDVSLNYAGIQMMAATSYRQPEQVKTYHAIAERVLNQFMSISFDSSPQDEEKIKNLLALDIEKIGTQVENFFRTSPDARTYYNSFDDIKRRENNIQAPKQGLLARWATFLGFALSALLIGAAVLPPLLGISLTVGPVLAVVAAYFAAVYTIYSEVRDYDNSVQDYQRAQEKWESEAKATEQSAYQALNAKIDPDQFINPKPPITPPYHEGKKSQNHSADDEASPEYQAKQLK